MMIVKVKKIANNHSRFCGRPKTIFFCVNEGNTKKKKLRWNGMGGEGDRLDSALWLDLSSPC